MLFVLAIFLLWLISSSCEKKKTRSLPSFSLEYNGTYFESNNEQPIRKTFDGYYLPIPIESYFIQIRLDTITTGTINSSAGMLWQYGNTYTAFNWVTTISSISGGEATGTFSGYMILMPQHDTIEITNGNFLNIEIQ